MFSLLLKFFLQPFVVFFLLLQLLMFCIPNEPIFEQTLLNLRCIINHNMHIYTFFFCYSSFRFLCDAVYVAHFVLGYSSFLLLTFCCSFTFTFACRLRLWLCILFFFCLLVGLFEIHLMNNDVDVAASQGDKKKKKWKKSERKLYHNIC